MINKRLEDLREVMRREHLAACSHYDTLACFVTEVEEN
jgi:hypothetical protein